jgi:hypothetical protein
MEPKSEKLEKRLCPHTTKRLEHIPTPWNIEEQTVYYCNIVGRRVSTYGPCSAEKAETCPYLGKGEQTSERNASHLSGIWDRDKC